ncbi:response regulator [Sediminibacterium ginsengisoli]|uniref:Response regulator receiver domain-containing protein n=1 Tax=Sediminibacterium ginsengisoli TaxID=413434 RepID=A0A1T4Q2E9_9BACT|nr:response regulator [Sediminibacterium ginsengisoli]SJZ97691.1 Response regulator receiver domain-containing protein [Sediminibacterium ginsengisoli]
MKRVLIIDDELDLCLLLKVHLTRKNYDVSLAHTLKEGIAKATQLSPDVLLLDNNLPDGMGWKIVDQLLAVNPAMKITLMSAFKSAHEAEVNDSVIKVLEKPVKLADIDSFL